MMIQVQVKLFLHLRKNRIQTVELADDSDAADLIRQLGVPVEEVGILSINNRQATLDQQVKNGDTVYIIPHIGGG